MFSNLIKTLVQQKSKFYSIDGCGYCDRQKKELGISGRSPLIVKCDDPKNKKMCTKMNGFPTWEIKGRLYPGFHTKKELNSILSKKST